MEVFAAPRGRRHHDNKPNRNIGLPIRGGVVKQKDREGEKGVFTQKSPGAGIEPLISL